VVEAEPRVVEQAEVLREERADRGERDAPVERERRVVVDEDLVEAPVRGQQVPPAGAPLQAVVPSSAEPRAMRTALTNECVALGRLTRASASTRFETPLRTCRSERRRPGRSST
jgi:hypothetical protein